MVMRVSGGATVVGKDLANETIVTPVKEAVRQNAIGVGVSVLSDQTMKHKLFRISQM